MAASTPPLRHRERGRLALASPQARRERGRLAALTRSRAPDDPDLVAARSYVAREALERHIAAASSALAPADRAHLAALLTRDGDGAAR
jgi:hypothetical protein